MTAADTEAVRRSCFKSVAREKPKVAVLIGAGCSYTAGVPLARLIVNRIIRKFADECETIPREGRRDYNTVTRVISDLQFLNLLRPYIAKAKINFAHLCLVELMRQGYVDRILTTNFDPLLIRATAMVGHFPAIYDCATVPFQYLKRVLSKDYPQIYYLHGQSYGLRVLNASDELERHSVTVREILDRTCDDRSLIVCGYSGESDQVLKLLETDSNVFWVAHTEQEGDAVRKIFGSRRGRSVIAPDDADRFFFGLLKYLKLKLPSIVSLPDQFADSLRGQIKFPDWYLESLRCDKQEPFKYQPTYSADEPALDFGFKAPSFPGPPSGPEWEGGSGRL